MSKSSYLGNQNNRHVDFLIGALYEIKSGNLDQISSKMKELYGYKVSKESLEITAERLVKENIVFESEGVYSINSDHSFVKASLSQD